MAFITKPIEVKANGNRTIWVRFEDGINGEIDLKDFEGNGVFKKWGKSVSFSSVHINPLNHSIAWDDELEIDSLNLYLELIGKTFEQWQHEHELVHAAN